MMIMRIGIDVRLPTYRMGGISQYVLQLLGALATLDTPHRYIALHSRKAEAALSPPAMDAPRVWTPPHHRLERWALGAELVRHRLDVMHSPDFIPPAFGAGRRVITVHDLSFLHYPQYLTAESRRYYNDQIAWAVAQADAIAADSEHTRRDLIEMLGVPPAKVTTIHLAANPAATQPVTPAAVDVTLARYRLARGFLLFVGTLEPRKNVPLLLEAYRCLRDRHAVRVPLVLVGRIGWLSDPIFAARDALGLAGHVRHIDDADDAALAHLYRAAAALALPSHYEGFGLPALEAMHAGCPVVVSDRASLPEIVGEAGDVLPADDVGAWCETLAALLHDPERRARRAAQGRRRAAQFTWRACAEQTLALYTGGVS